MATDFVDIFDAPDEEMTGPDPEPARAPSPLWLPPPPEERGDLFPVQLEHWRDHSFKKKDGGRRGCAVCNAGKIRAVHHGRPDSFNEGGSGTNWMAYQSKKKVWMELLSEKLVESGLPKGLGRVVVEGVMTFGRRPGHRGPDQDNYRFPLSKALGDALEDGGWLEQDNWLRYEFGGLQYRYEKGREGFQLTLFPSWETPDGDGLPAQAALL